MRCRLRGVLALLPLLIPAASFGTEVLGVADRSAVSQPYVKSMEGFGAFYARAIPAGRKGTAGTTKIYRVEADGDQLLDTYNWYAPNGVVLCWSPLPVGNVAVMALGAGTQAAQAPTAQAQTAEPVEWAFHLDGRLLKAYTAEDLAALGVRTLITSEGPRAAYRVTGCEQHAPGTNEYDFVVEINGGARTLRFDITTGELRPAAVSPAVE